MSSRNQRLSAQEREIASHVYNILAQSLTISKESVSYIVNFVKAEVNKIPEIKLEYFQIVDDITLQELDTFNSNQGIVGCIAFYIRDVRLIDNIRYQ